jgi:hypothetical protein
MRSMPLEKLGIALTSTETEPTATAHKMVRDRMFAFADFYASRSARAIPEDHS